MDVKILRSFEINNKKSKDDLFPEMKYSQRLFYFHSIEQFMFNCWKNF